MLQYNHNKGFIGKVMIVVIILVVGLLLIPQDDHLASYSNSYVQKQNYNELIRKWNDDNIQNLEIENKVNFFLERSDNEKVIQQLMKFTADFYLPRLTNHPKYNTFLYENKFEKPIRFEQKMTSQEIEEKLKEITKEEDTSKAIKKIIMMNDYEFWKKESKL